MNTETDDGPADETGRLLAEQVSFDSEFDALGPDGTAELDELVAMELADIIETACEHGQTKDLAVERRNARGGRTSEAAERGRTASSKLIDISRQKPDATALRNATQAPLSAANLILDVLEDFQEAEHDLPQSVPSDFFGGIELLSGAFLAVMVGVESKTTTANLLGPVPLDRLDLRLFLFPFLLGYWRWLEDLGLLRIPNDAVGNTLLQLITEVGRRRAAGCVEI